jgi:hypothetical protein
MTTKELQQIALGLLHGTLIPDWESPCGDITTLSEVEALLWQTRDIALLIGDTTHLFDEDPYGHQIFSQFITLTHEEAFQVAQMYLRYQTFLTTYQEVEISHT